MEGPGIPSIANSGGSTRSNREPNWHGTCSWTCDLRQSASSEQPSPSVVGGVCWSKGQRSTFSSIARCPIRKGSTV
eukprot:1397970-Rhodomonas_salina.1